MKCPSCRSELDAPAARCPECRISLQKLDMKYGMVPRHSRYLSDRSARLAVAEMEPLRESLRLFEKKFPQVLLSVFVAELQPDGTASEYAFWLANRAKFSSVEKTEAENMDLVLVIDVTSQTAALSTGYGLEKFVPEELLEEALAAGARHFREDELATGILACIDALTRRLRKCAFQARKTASAELAEVAK